MTCVFETELTPILLSFLLSSEPTPVLTGRPATVLVFLAAECPIANDYQPKLAEIQKALRAKQGEMFGVYVDPRMTDAQAIDHAKQFKAGYVPFVDRGHKLVRKFGATVTPQVFVLDKAGKVRYSGRIDDTYPDIGVQRRAAKHDDLKNAINAVLAGKTPSPAKTDAVGCVIPDLGSYGG